MSALPPSAARAEAAACLAASSLLAGLVDLARGLVGLSRGGGAGGDQGGLAMGVGLQIGQAGLGGLHVSLALAIGGLQLVDLQPG